MAPRPSADFRERLVAALDAGLAPSEAARLFGVDRRTVFRWRARHRRGESLAEQPRSGRPPKLDPARYEQLRAVVLTHPDATLPEHVARLAAVTGVSLSPSHLSRLLAKLGLRLKKEPDRRRTRRGGPCRLSHGDGQG
jgi:transposase